MIISRAQSQVGSMWEALASGGAYEAAGGGEDAQGAAVALMERG